MFLDRWLSIGVFSKFPLFLLHFKQLDHFSFTIRRGNRGQHISVINNIKENRKQNPPVCRKEFDKAPIKKLNSRSWSKCLTNTRRLGWWVTRKKESLAAFLGTNERAQELWRTKEPESVLRMLVVYEGEGENELFSLYVYRVGVNNRHPLAT